MELKDLGKAPISDDAPAGKDVRYEPGFEALSEEIAKMGSPSASSGIDWQNVINLSVQILEKESKHLQVASYLSFGLLKTSGLEGLAPGVHVLRELLENFWDPMFPPKKRMKGRRGIVEWWTEKISDFISGTDPVTWEKEARDALIDDLNALDTFLSENMPDAPLLLPLIRQVQEVIMEPADPEPAPEPEAPPQPESTPEPVPQPPPAQQPAAAPPPAQPAAPAPPAQPVAAPAIGPDAGISEILDQGLKFIGKLASEIRKADKTHPLPYRLSRIAAWSSIDALPLATGGKTMIPPPDGQVIAAISNLADAGNWDALADACEGKVKQFLFWLDLSRYVSESMTQLGYTDVAQVVDMETALFVQRFNGVETLCFSNGTPFADETTREWLSQISAAASQGDAVSASGPGDPAGKTLTDTTNQAQQLIKDKQPDVALALLNKHLSTAGSERERFLWKMALCKVLIQLKQVKIASSYIDDILKCIDTHHLEIWEPRQAVEALALSLTGLRLMKDNQNTQTIESVIKRISMIDPVKAIQVV